MVLYVTQLRSALVEPGCTNLVKVIGGGVVVDVVFRRVDATKPLQCDISVLGGPSSRVGGKSWCTLGGIF